jgi:hypothetical protein
MVLLDDFRRLAGLTDERVLREAGDAEGYRIEFSEQHLTNFYETDPKRRQYTVYVVKAFAPSGELVASVDFAEADGKLMPGQVVTDKAHRRKGLATAMYRLAEKKTGLKVGPALANARTKDGTAFRASYRSEAAGDEDLKSIHATLSAAIVANDKAAEETMKAWVKAAPKKTCPRCQGTGIKANEIVVYAGSMGGCYQCNKKGVIPKDQKGAKAAATEAELTRLRSNWKAYKAAATAMAKAVAAAQTPSEKRTAEWRLKDYERMLKSLEDAGKYAKLGESREDADLLLKKLDTHLANAAEWTQAGFYFEEGGCFGMALALRARLEAAGERVSLVLHRQSVHAAVLVRGSIWDWQGKSRYDPANWDLVTLSNFRRAAMKHTSTSELASDQNWANETIDAALGAE